MRNKSPLFLIFLSLSLSGCEVASFGGDSSNSSKINSSSSTNLSNSESISTGSSSTSSSGDSSSSSIDVSSGSSSSSSSSSIIDPKTDPSKKWLIAEPNVNECPIRTNKNQFVYTDLFNLHNHVDIHIDISNSELYKLEADRTLDIVDKPNKSEIYRLASKVTITINNNGNDYVWEYNNVGIRQKGGDFARNEVINDWTGYINTYNHYKLSFDETFTDTSVYGEEFVAQYGDSTYKDRAFLGLDALDIKYNRNEDQTYLREIYASYLYKANGLIAQSIGLTTFSMKNEAGNSDFGLCYLFQTGSKKLIRQAMESNDYYVNMPAWSDEKKGSYGVSGVKYGDMYKATYGRGTGYNRGPDFTSESTINNGTQAAIGIKDDIYGRRFPIYERKTNTDVSYSDDLLRNVINTANNSNYSTIKNLVDIEYLAKEEAVSFFVGNPDSFRYNYNNYQVYFRRVDGKMILIPIDNDRAFGVGNTWSDGLNFVNNTYLKPTSSSTISGSNRNPLIAKTLLADTECQQLFLTHVARLRESSWLDNSTFTSFYDVIRDTYSEDAYFSLSNGDNVTFSSYIANKKEASKVEKEPEDTSSSQASSEITSNFFDGYQDELYLIGTFNSWFSGYSETEMNAYHLTQSSSNSYIYQLTFSVYSYEEGSYFKFKINGGPTMYSYINYGDSGTYGQLAYGELTSSIRYYPSDTSSPHSFTIYVDIRDGSYSITEN